MLLTVILSVWGLSAGRAESAPPPGTQGIAPSVYTAICLDQVPGRCQVECGNFHCEVQDGFLMEMYKATTSVSGQCLIPKSGIVPPCEVTQTDESGRRGPVNFILKSLDLIMPTPPVIITTPSTTIPVSAGTTAPDITGSSWTGIIVAACLVLVLGLVMFQMYRSGYFRRLLTKCKTQKSQDRNRDLGDPSSFIPTSV